MAENDLIEVKAYKCVYCDLLSENKKDIQTHLDENPIQPTLPIGLVYKNNLEGLFKDGLFPYAIVNDVEFDQNHTAENKVILLRSIVSNNLDAFGGISYASFVKRLVEGSNSFLDEKEFQEFAESNKGLLKKLNEIEKFIRIIPGLDKLSR